MTFDTDSYLLAGCVILAAMLNFIALRKHGSQQNWEALYREKWAAAEKRDLIIEERDKEIKRLQVGSAEHERQRLSDIEALTARYEERIRTLSAPAEILKDLYTLILEYFELAARFPSSHAVLTPFVNTWKPLVGNTQYGEDVRAMMAWHNSVGKFLRRYDNHPQVRTSILKSSYEMRASTPARETVLGLLIETWGTIAGYQESDSSAGEQ